MLYSLLENVKSNVTIAISEDRTCIRLVSEQATSGGAINILRQAAKARMVEPAIKYVSVAYPNLTQKDRAKQEKSMREIVKALGSDIKINVLKTDFTTDFQVQTILDVEC